jgi:hypothetical protein
MELPMSGTAGAADAAQMERFRERVARIEKKAGKIELAPLGAVEFDDKGTPIIHQAPSLRAQRFSMNLRKLILLPFMLAIAIGVGALMVVATRFGRTIWDGGSLTGDGAGPAMLMDAGIALAALLVLRVLLRRRSRTTLVGNLGGLALGLLAMHNLVHVAPGVWTTAFPEAWVSDVLATTEPHSILIRGVSYEL